MGFDCSECFRFVLFFGGVFLLLFLGFSFFVLFLFVGYCLELLGLSWNFGFGCFDFVASVFFIFGLVRFDIYFFFGFDSVFVFF